MARSDLLVWIDMEMTGLYPETDVIIEVATLITDNDLNIVAEGPDLAIHQSDSILAGMDEWNTEHHGASGLVDKVRASNIDVVEAERLTLEFVAEHCTRRSAPLCGNSIWQDRRFLHKYMPALGEYLHYRSIDVSSLKELAKRWNTGASPPRKGASHRAMDDIRESIAELRYYREFLFK